MNKDKLHVFGDLDAAKVIDLFVDSLVDPLHPKHCLNVTYACLFSLHDGFECFPNRETLVLEHPALYQTCANFITVARTSEEMKLLGKTFPKCRCDLSNETIRELHIIADVAIDPTGCTWSFSELITAVLDDALEIARPIGHINENADSAAQARRPGQRSAWPCCAQDILPYGPETSITSIGKWVDTHPEPLVLAFLASMLRVGQQDVVPYFVSSPSLPGNFMRITEKHLQRAKLDPTSGRIIAQLPADGLLYMVGAASLAKQLQRSCSLDELAVFAHHAELQHRPVIEFCEDIVEWLPLLDAAIQPRSLYTRRGQASDDTVENAIKFCKRMFLNLATAVHSALKLPRDPKKYNRLMLLVQMMWAESDSVSIFDTFQNFHELHCCFNPSCTAKYKPTGPKFPLCSRCQRVPYCSKKCQIEAWTSPAAPHKAVCKRIKWWAEITEMPREPVDSDRASYTTRATNIGTLVEDDATDIIAYGQAVQAEQAKVKAQQTQAAKCEFLSFRTR